MRTYLDCIPCFLKQALEASRIAGASPELQRDILMEVARAIQTFSLESTPPEMGRIIHSIIKEKTGNVDPYREIRFRSNELLLSVYDRLKEFVYSSQDSLLKSVELAIYGNIIDYGPNSSAKVEEELRTITMEREIPLTKCSGRFQFDDFREALRKAGKVLYIADNAGEIVFDKLLIEEIRNASDNLEIVVAVKERPIINDATMEDAEFCGVHEVAKVISSGSDAPGTILSLCSDEFLEVFHKADVVVSKGQGNFEALSEVKGNIFFMLMAKCDVVASHLGCNVGEIILFRNFREKGEEG